jgi:Spy/CpxP family protein refolding chaperone
MNPMTRKKMNMHSISRRLVTLVVATAAVAFVPDPALATDQAQAHSWWKSEEFRTALGLTEDQSARIDSIFQTTLPQLREDMDDLDRLEGRLSRLIESDADETEIARHIDRVETARANINKTRSLMLVRMRRVLTPEQRVRMRTLEEESRKRGFDPRRRPAPESNKAPGS